MFTFPCAIAVPSTGFDYDASLTRAQQLAGLKDEAVAAILGISREQWGQQKRSQGHLSFQRMALLSKDRDGLVLLRAYLTEWAAFHGVTNLELPALWLREAVRSFARLRMAKASLPARKQTKEVA